MGTIPVGWYSPEDPEMEVKRLRARLDQVLRENADLRQPKLNIINMESYRGDPQPQ